MSKDIRNGRLYNPEKNIQALMEHLNALANEKASDHLELLELPNMSIKIHTDPGACIEMSPEYLLAKQVF